MSVLYHFLKCRTLFLFCISNSKPFAYYNWDLIFFLEIEIEHSKNFYSFKMLKRLLLSFLLFFVFFLR